MSKYTPAPWIIDDMIVQNADGFVIATLSEADDFPCVDDDDGEGPTSAEIDAECEANAHLIIAAPELLKIAQRWAALDAGSWHVDRHASEKKELLADTAWAISKATGAK